MKIHTQGFSLIQVTIYVMVSLCVVTCLYFSLFFIGFPIIGEVKNKQAFVALTIALDACVKEIRSFRPSVCKEYKSDMVVFSTDQYDVGWWFDDEKLKRIQGYYDNNAWKHQKTVLVAGSIKKGQFIADEQDMKGMTIQAWSLEYPDVSVSAYIAL